MESKITIQNTNIARYVRFKLKKIDNEFTEEELAQITEIIIDYNEEDVTRINLDELLLFKNLNTLCIRNGFIDNDYFEVLLNLEKLCNICFEKCSFENEVLIASLNIKELSLINCSIEDYNFIVVLEDLKRLKIINGIVNIKNINMLKNLNYLQISYSKIIDSNVKLNLKNINELYIDNTDISDLSFTNNLRYLKNLGINETQYLNNLDIVSQLIKRNVKLYDENMINFVGDKNEL